MSAEDIEGLGFPVERDQIFLEGDAYDRLLIEVADARRIEAVFWEGRLGDITTSSPPLWAGAAGALAGFGLRAGAIHYGWALPAFGERRGERET